jgi:hypothetical protein
MELGGMYLDFVLGCIDIEFWPACGGFSFGAWWAVIFGFLG